MRYFILILWLLKFHVDAADWLNRTVRVDLIVNPKAIHTQYDILERRVRILSGVNATNGQYPWSIYTTAWANLGSGWRIGVPCSGSIISENFVLTDFYCVGRGGLNPPATSIEVLFGSAVFQYPFTPTGFVRHYWYIQPSIENRPSIVLLRLHESLIFNPNIQPIRLPSHDNFLYEDWASYILGFDYGVGTEQLQSVNVNICNNNLCKFSGNTADHEICAIPPNNGSLIGTNGFRGGAWLVYEYTRGFEFIPVLVGIHEDTSQTGSFALATRVSHFIDWIEQLTTTTEN